MTRSGRVGRHEDILPHELVERVPVGVDRTVKSSWQVGSSRFVFERFGSVVSPCRLSNSVVKQAYAKVKHEQVGTTDLRRKPVTTG